LLFTDDRSDNEDSGEEFCPPDVEEETGSSDGSILLGTDDEGCTTPSRPVQEPVEPDAGSSDMFFGTDDDGDPVPARSPQGPEEPDVILSFDELCPPTSLRQKKLGRKQSVIWDEYITIKEAGKIISNKCKYCSIEVSKQPSRMQKHTEKCSAFNRRNSSKFPDANASSCRGFPVSAPTVPVVFSGRKKIQPSIDGFVKQITQKESKNVDNLIGRMIFTNNLPFTLADSGAFKDLIKALHPGYKAPSSKLISEGILNDVYDNVKKKTAENLQNKTIAIAQDGWTTNQNVSIIAHTMIADGKSYFLDATDTQSNAKTGEFCAKLLEESISKAEQEYGVTVAGIVTDNCSSMTSLRNIMSSRFPELRSYGCNSHLLNLLGDKFTPDELIDQVISVQKHIRSHCFTSACLRTFKGLRPVLPSSTRWNSQIECCTNFLTNHGKYLDVMRESMKQTKSKAEMTKDENVYQILRNNQVYDDVKELVQVLSPIRSALDLVSLIH
jgi:hypothetical protein